MATFYTADWHINHANIIRLCGRPFYDVADMNAQLIDRHNTKVGPDDRVWVLGDVALGPIAESLALVKEFAGHLILVLGNHDRPFEAWRKGQAEKYQAWADRYLAAGFEAVVPGAVATQLPALGDVLLSHFPYRGDSHDEDRFADQRPHDDGRPLLHGHVHDKWRRHANMLNVGVDVWDFYPVPESEIVRAFARDHGQT